MRVRPATLIGLLFAALGFGMAMAVDRGVTHDWPYGARVAWAVSLVVCALAGIITVLVSEGLVSNDLLEGVGPAGERSPNMAMFLGVYVGSLAVGIALAVILERQYGINAYRTILVYCGGFFLLGATGHPWWIFATLRRPSVTTSNPAIRGRRKTGHSAGAQGEGDVARPILATQGV
jgi:hypothetical protein